MNKYSQTQLFGRFRLVMTRTLPADRAIGIAQQTTRGVERPLLLMGENSNYVGGDRWVGRACEVCLDYD